MALPTMNEWQNKEWECFKDIHVCALGCCCPLCLIAKTAKDLGENPIACCCLGYFCPVGAIFLLRKKARENFGIDGSAGMDVLCACCLPACVMCQTEAEVRSRNGTTGQMPSW